MMCLSLSQPWAWCVVHGPKRIENRSTASIAGVARTLIGKRIALQAAKSYDDRGAEHIRDTGLVVPMRVELDLVAGKVIGVATITHVFQCTNSHRGTFVGFEPPADQLVWAFGPWCFMFADVRAIARPVVQRGFPGFFPLPSFIESQVVDQLEVTGG